MKDTFTSKPVEITAGSRRILTGLKTTLIDSLMLSAQQTSNLAELMMQTNSVFFKALGPRLSSPVFRGTTASQSKLYWEGVPITSGTHGTFDYTLIPAALMDEAEVSFGNASLKNGSGSLGIGINMLTDDKPRNELLKMCFALGSFHTYKTFFSLNAGNEKLWSSTSVYYDNVKNDYTFLNIAKAGSPAELQTRAAYTQYGITEKIGWQINTKNLLCLTGWYHVSPAEITPPLVSNSVERKKDSSLRILLKHTMTMEKSSLVNTLYYGNERLKYINTTASLFEVNNATRLFAKSEYTGSIRENILYRTHASMQHDEAITEHYNGVPKQTKFSAFATGTHSPSKYLRYTLQARQEVINQKKMPFIYNADVMAGLIENYRLYVKASYGNNYNYPSINDLYWVPGGNPALRPEYSRQAEAGLHFTLPLKIGFVSGDFTAYRNIVNDQILWMPGSGSLWQAYNLRKVEVTGLECHSEAHLRYGDLSFIPKIKYTYTRSINKESVSAYDDSKNKQVPYVPYDLFAANLRFIYKTLDCYTEYIYTGFRYTNTDNSAYVNAYNLVNISAGKSFTLRQTFMVLRLKINNLLNENYQAVAWYPIPGRYIEISTQIHLNKITKQ